MIQSSFKPSCVFDATHCRTTVFAKYAYIYIYIYIYICAYIYMPIYIYIYGILGKMFKMS